MKRFSPGPGSSLLLKLLALGIVGAAACLSRTVWTHEPAAPVPERSAALPLRAVGAVHPRLAPDGNNMVFSYQGGIWRMPAQGGTMRRLAAGAGFAVEPCWSPDGRQIAFLQGRSWGSGVVKLIDAQTGKRIASPPVDVLGAGPLFFTPDGSRLVGYLRSQTQTEALRALDLKTGKLTLIQPLRSWRQPWALSANGKWIALITTLDLPEEQTGSNGPQVDIWKVGLAGGEPEHLVRFPARIHGLCCSADGKALYASTELGGIHNDIWRIVLSDPQRPTKITFGQADEDWPSVSTDGRRLLYSDNHEGCPALVLLELGAAGFSPEGRQQTLTVNRLDFGVPAGRLSLDVRDKATGQPLIARVAIEHQDGSFHAPPGALWRVFGDVGHFYARGRVEIDLPAGTYHIRAWHGPEYGRAESHLEISPGKTAEQTLLVQRWTDPNARGWYSGENHIHANYGYGEYYNSPATMAEMCAGEGLNIANLMVANSDGDGVFDREFFRGRPDPLSTRQSILYWNEEYRSTIWGHMTLVNLKQRATRGQPGRGSNRGLRQAGRRAW